MKEIKNYAGFEYVIVKTDKKSIPMQILLKIEKDITKEIIKSRPIRGKELHFLRKQLGLSCAKLAVSLEGAVDASTISRLEAKSDVRLRPRDEVFFRIFFAEKLNIKISPKFKELSPNDNNKSLTLAA